MIRALVFDFDGLILETEAPIYESWLALYQSYGFPLPFETWATIIGTADISGFDPPRELERLVGRPLDWEAIEAQRGRHEQALIAQQPILPGVVQYLQDAQRLGLRVGLASSSPRTWVAGHLERLGLMKYFQAVYTSDDVARTKPDPELYRSALAALGAAPGQAIAFEDSTNGIRAAKGAGMFCVAVPTPFTRGMPMHEAYLKLGSLAEVKLEGLVKLETFMTSSLTTEN